MSTFLNIFFHFPHLPNLFHLIILPSQIFLIPHQNSADFLQFQPTDTPLELVLPLPPSLIVDSSLLRRSTRSHNSHSYLQDYHCSLAQGAAPVFPDATYPISDTLSYSKLTQTHKAFSIALLTNIEPTHYNQAAQFPEWKETMQAELQALAANDTWAVTSLPPWKTAIGSKWV